MAKYYFRLDDLCPEMDMGKYLTCLEIFQKHLIAPLVGVIPENRDATLRRAPFDPDFWETISRLSDEKKIVIAQHGLYHQYVKSNKAWHYKYGIGLNTEFAGLPYHVQLGKLTLGRTLLSDHGIDTDIFMPPNHSFDRETLRALRAAGFRYLSDGIGLYPYRRCGIIFLPQISGKPRRMPVGSTTICIHPNTMNAVDFDRLDKFLSLNRSMNFSSFLSEKAPWYSPLANGLVRIIYFLGKNAKAFIRRPFRARHAGKGRAA
jgi:hypothetical protein